MEANIYSQATDAVMAARLAFKRYQNLTIADRNEIIEALRTQLRDQADTLARMTVEESGMGNIADKERKFLMALNNTPGVEDLVTEATTGDHGMTLYEYSAYGVVCTVLPCTNPCATLINNTISALAAGNTVIHCPNARAVKVSQYLTGLIGKIVFETCGISNMVVALDENLLGEIREVMSHPDVDLVVCTGGEHALSKALACGKRVIAAGPANPVAIVDETADIEDAARDIIQGATFDNNLMCTSEKHIVVTSQAAEPLVRSMIRQGVFFTEEPDVIEKIADTIMGPDGRADRRLEGKSADELLDKAGIVHDRNVRLIAVHTDICNRLVMTELMMPIVSIVVAKDFDEALLKALDIEQGYRHTATVFSQRVDRMNLAAKKMQTAVFVKNGPSFNGIGFDRDGNVSFTIGTLTGEGTTTARNYARRRRCTLCGGFEIR